MTDEQILVLAGDKAKERGDFDRSDRFYMAAADHEQGECPRANSRPCDAVAKARAALAEYGVEVPAPVEHVEQPMPTPNNHPSIQSLVRADLEKREQVGISRYGTALQPHNGRDALRDAYEEALDLACYLKQAMVEREAKARYFVVNDEGDEESHYRVTPNPSSIVEIRNMVTGKWARTGWGSADELAANYDSCREVSSA